MNLAILELHAIRQVGKHRQLHLRVPGVSSADEERIFEILVDTGAQVSLVRRGLLSSQSLRRSAAPVTLKVANGEIMEGGLNEAEINLDLRPPRAAVATRSRSQTPNQGVVLRGGPASVGHGHGVRLLGHGPRRGPSAQAHLARRGGRQAQLAGHIHGASGAPVAASRARRLGQAVRSVLTRPPTANIEDGYGLSQGAFHMALGGVDVFGSAALRRCPRVWTKEDNGWKRGWSGDLWDVLYIHAPRGSLERVVAKIALARGRAVVTFPSWEIHDAKDAPWVQDLRCMTLIDTQLPSTKDIFVDAQGNPLPPRAKGWTTTVAYVDESLAHPDRDMGMSSITARVQPEGCTIVDRPERSISRIMALPVRYWEETADGWCCPPAMAQDALSPDELDMVCGYMSSAMVPGGPIQGTARQVLVGRPCAPYGTLHEERVVGVCVGALGGPRRTSRVQPAILGRLV